MEFCPKKQKRVNPETPKEKPSSFRHSPASYSGGGETGIRTLDTLLTYTHFPGALLKPLGHLSGFALQTQFLDFKNPAKIARFQKRVQR